MYAACIRARAQRDLSALGRVSVGQVEWIVNVSGRTSPRWRPPPGASLFTPHGSPRGKSSMARVENSNPRIHYQFHSCFFYQSPRNFADWLSFHNEFFFSLSLLSFFVTRHRHIFVPTLKCCFSNECRMFCNTIRNDRCQILQFVE